MHLRTIDSRSMASLWGWDLRTICSDGRVASLSAIPMCICPAVVHSCLCTGHMEGNSEADAELRRSLAAFPTSGNHERLRRIQLRLQPIHAGDQEQHFQE